MNQRCLFLLLFCLLRACRRSASPADRYRYVQRQTHNPRGPWWYRMEQQGLTNKDLAQILGFKSRVSDIFKNNRKLNLSMIRKLYNTLHIPLETLVKEY